LKRLYDIFSIKSKLLIGDQEKNNKNFDTFYNSGSAFGLNIDFSNELSTSTYTVTAGTKFIAVQKFNNVPIVIDPMNVPTTTITTGYTSAYPLSDYNVYSTWGWPLDEEVIGNDLSLLYNFYVYKENIYTDTISNNIITGPNILNTKRNIDYQLRKGLNL